MSLSLLPKLSSNLENFIQDLHAIEPLLDVLSDVVFFIKNTKAEYVFVNQTLVKRCGLSNKHDLLNKTSAQIFEGISGDAYTQQDHEILRKKSKLTNHLELHLYHHYESGWCLTHKEPLFDPLGNMVGIAGISKDLHSTEHTHRAFHKVLDVENYIKQNISQPILMSDLTKITQTSIAQLERYCKRIYQLTPRQMISKYRLQQALELLKENIPIIEISLKCGYTDHSAFCRHFKIHTGMSPTQYRQLIK
ncbi:helix-turn-helix domain-containing protein [Acinetobacter sp. B5B]|uniref:helix-turn-helix domain-containing protein n=1 Tax=Acinetobacter baretiae TaxID=2605383 RepID=UPI0018C25ED8|nr:helix-turn-helix domain-containing protein [Acinetobacter baretiae]MBF7682625.1 helix-turn-helix domain-containing protein [Acinetobacter baretiae]MBF7685603.1 helix-turn-helix domain-containing protein [Acinetobacter baretiae]